MPVQIDVEAVGRFFSGRLGLERLAAMKYGIKDIRTLWQPPYVRRVAPATNRKVGPAHGQAGISLAISSLPGMISRQGSRSMIQIHHCTEADYPGVVAVADSLVEWFDDHARTSDIMPAKVARADHYSASRAGD